MTSSTTPAAWTAPLVLGIESSCDDTACAVVDGSGRVLSSVVSSQLSVHRPWGGVVPELASREHLSSWPTVLEATLEQAGIGLGDLDAIAATRGPGLLGSLLVGLSLGRALAVSRGLSFHAVHHLEGHLFSPFLRLDREPAEEPPSRLIGLVVSGGHTSLFEVEGADTTPRLSTLGETRDDAFGEVFDKVGKRLGLPYPGGPLVDRLAESGNTAHRLPVPRCDGLDFSYSGLKSEAIRTIERLERDATGESPGAPGPLTETVVADICASFRQAAVAQILERLERLRERGPMPLLAVSGGAAANRLLRRELTSWCEHHGVALRLVALPYSSDNAAMIAWAGVLRARRGLADDPLFVEAKSRFPLAEAFGSDPTPDPRPPNPSPSS